MMAEWSLAPPTQPGSQGMAAGACWIGRHGQKVEGKSEETLASRAGTTEAFSLVSTQMYAHSTV